MNTEIKIPTAQEYLESKYPYILEEDNKEVIFKALREFTELHVDAALKAAANNGVKMSSTWGTIYNSYSKENIK